MYLKISFNCLYSRKKKNGQVPIYCLICQNNQTIRFSTGVSVDEKSWDRKRNTIKTSNEPKIAIAKQTLKQIEDNLLIEANLILSKDGKIENVKDIINSYKGVKSNRPSYLMEVYKLKFEKMGQLLGKGYTKSTLSKYSQMARAVGDFIKIELKTNDIKLEEVTRPFLDDLELFLRTNRNMKPISSNKVIQGLKSVILYAYEREWMTKNPFVNHKFKPVETEILYLTKEQIIDLEKSTFSQPRLELVKDLFLFSIYTGLHYSDAMTLTKSNLIYGIDGKPWIEYNRSKTGKKILIPLLDKAQASLKKFKLIVGQSEYLLPRFSNQKINSYLKEIADILDIDMPLTHKIARKTFGSILLFNNVPIKVVSELLGHSNSLITEKHYAKLDTRKLGEAMSLLNK